MTQANETAVLQLLELMSGEPVRAMEGAKGLLALPSHAVNASILVKVALDAGYRPWSRIGAVYALGFAAGGRWDEPGFGAAVDFAECGGKCSFAWTCGGSAGESAGFAFDGFAAREVDGYDGAAQCAAMVYLCAGGVGYAGSERSIAGTLRVREFEAFWRKRCMR